MTKIQKVKALQSHLSKTAGVQMTQVWCKAHLDEYVFTDDGIFHVNEWAKMQSVDSEIKEDNSDSYCSESPKNEISEPTVTSEIEPVDFEIDSNELLNSEQNDHSSEQNDHSSEQNDPDGDDLHYPPEIDSPDPDFDHDSPEVDYPDYQLLLDKFKEENPHFTILESKFFTVPYWHLKESKVMIFGYGGDGDRWGIFSVISFTKNRTNHIYDGCYEQCRIVYREYCEEVGKFSVAPEPPKNPMIEAYKQELTPQGFLFTRKQLALF